MSHLSYVEAALQQPKEVNVSRDTNPVCSLDANLSGCWSAFTQVTRVSAILATGILVAAALLQLSLHKWNAILINSVKGPCCPVKSQSREVLPVRRTPGIFINLGAADKCTPGVGPVGKALAIPACECISSLRVLHTSAHLGRSPTYYTVRPEVGSCRHIHQLTRA